MERVHRDFLDLAPATSGRAPLPGYDQMDPFSMEPRPGTAFRIMAEENDRLDQFLAMLKRRCGTNLNIRQILTSIEVGFGGEAVNHTGYRFAYE